MIEIILLLVYTAACFIVPIHIIFWIDSKINDIWAFGYEPPSLLFCVTISGIIWLLGVFLLFHCY